MNRSTIYEFLRKDSPLEFSKDGGKTLVDL